MNTQRQTEIERRVAEQASEWFTVLEDEDTLQHRTGFAEWIAQSPLHVRAFLQVTATERLLEGLDEACWAQAAGRAGASNVVTLREPAPLPQARPARRRWLAGAGLAAALLAAAVLWQHLAGWERYTTDIGEQRSVELADGSVVHMNAKSRVEVRFSKAARELRLVDGEALFRVQRDPDRPFRVHVEALAVQAVGTQFNIDRRPDRTAVVVTEGAVRISRGPADERADQLTAGEGIRLTADGALEKQTGIDIGQVTAWRQRRLVFEEDTLADIAAEFNRYNRSPRIRLEGAAGARRYAAVFDADDPESLLEFLRRDPALAFRSRGGELIIAQRD